MAYTDKDAIYAIAEKLGWSGTEGQTTVEAVYAVAEALGYTGDHDNQVALALSDLYTVVSGGGGGGSYGPTLVIYAAVTSAPVEGSSFTNTMWGAVRARIGDMVVARVEPAFTYQTGLVTFATGLTVDTMAAPAAYSKCDVYAVTVSSGKYATVRELDIEITRHETTYQGQDAYYWSFVIAEDDIESDEYVVVNPHA